METERYRRRLTSGGPFTQQLEADNGKEIFATRDLQRNNVLVFNNLVVRKEFAEKYPDLVVKFLRVVQDKVDQYRKIRKARRRRSPSIWTSRSKPRAVRWLVSNIRHWRSN